jgi:AraC-like DNA-binding protein
MKKRIYFVTVLTWIVEKALFNDEFKSRFRGIPLAVARTDLMREGRDCRVLSHQHKELELICMTAGCANFYIDTAHFHLVAGDVLIIPPYAIHRADAAVCDGGAWECLCFDLSLLHDTALCMGLENGTLAAKPHITTGIPSASALFSYAQSAFAAYEAQENGWELASTGSLLLFFATLKREGLLSVTNAAGRGNDFCTRVIEYISHHYSEPITSATLAAHLYMSPAYFCRIFKSNFSVCFADYLAAYRIEKAKALLTGEASTISEVANRVGFQGFSYFSKTFHKLCGCTPSEYKNRLSH